MESKDQSDRLCVNLKSFPMVVIVVDLSVVFLVDLTGICEDGMVGNILT